MRKKQYLKSAVVFLAIIFIFPIMIFFSKKKEFSETENRSLEKFPEMKAEAIKDKSFMNGIETYLSDHFPFRIGWVKTKLNLERITGKELINGIYILDKAMYEKLPDPDYDEIEKSVTAINDFARENEDMKVFVMLVPTSAEIYKDEFEAYHTQIDQKKLINSIYSKFIRNVNTIDIYGAMYSARNEYIYYRTDHHWTTKGAFTAYKYAAGKMGLKSYENYDIETVSDSYRGTFYSKCLYDGVKPDLIDIYKPENDVKALSTVLNNGVGEEFADDIYFDEFLETNDKYCVFLGRNRAFTKIKTNADTDRKLLVIKDSYANCFVPFMMQNYSEIAVIDPRYLKTGLEEFVNPDDYDHTLFLYNASTFSTDKNVKNIGLKN